jgi:EAL domain-containing protein (putative c-di-GMP-specific phosphodiesterase class I)
MGCDVAQGYYFSRPIPAHTMTDWLTRFEEVQLAASLAGAL